MKTQQQTIDDITSQILKMETLDTRNSDEFDFHELAVWQIKEALQAAYKAGNEQNEAKKLNEQTNK